MGDLFHPRVPDAWITRILDVASKTPQHIYQILTKRADRMLRFFRRLGKSPLPNVWLGATAENQGTFDKRARYLIQTPAAVRFLSIEPMLGPVDMRRWLSIHETGCGGCGDCLACWSGTEFPVDIDGIDWVIVGGESGPNARPMHPDWVRSVRDQCVESSTPFFFKQIMVDRKMHKLPELDGRKWEEVPCG
jgi:protein gp37